MKHSMMNYKGVSYRSVCFWNNDLEEMIEIVHGQRGYYSVGEQFDNPSAAIKTTDNGFDLTNNVPVVVIEAFTAGSLFGWDCPAATPNT